MERIIDMRLEEDGIRCAMTSVENIYLGMISSQKAVGNYLIPEQKS